MSSLLAGWTGACYGSLVAIYNGDGSVAISHGGIEVGQGISTKVAQVCAYELGIPLETVTVRSPDNLVVANSITTGGSITSELVCQVIDDIYKFLQLFYQMISSNNFVKICLRLLLSVAKR